MELVKQVRVARRVARHDGAPHRIGRLVQHCTAVVLLEPLERVDVSQCSRCALLAGRQRIVRDASPRLERPLVKSDGGTHLRVHRAREQPVDGHRVFPQPEVVQLPSRQLRPERRINRALPRLELQHLVGRRWGVARRNRGGHRAC